MIYQPHEMYFSLNLSTLVSATAGGPDGTCAFVTVSIQYYLIIIRCTSA